MQPIKKHLPFMLMAPLAALFLIHFVGLFMLANAADEPVDLASAVLALFGAIKEKAVFAVVLMHVFKVLRTNESIGILGKIGLSGTGMRVAVAVLTVGGYVLNSYLINGNLGQAAIEGLFTSGGAMLLYDAFRASAVKVAVEHDEKLVAGLALKKVGALKA